ncbi:uncharacterized protein PgNI_03445 [Pyricularia grisea]|uniref:Uncharacterized protein n=1 Tax=Pyricularia grisea TaxID=148305 RepID=A0A6P8BDS8_PYRGI|nr:uncharacterized protein PgNI_03445 [Pyricularia grisea]TLD13842.1 hypothetical protein PgNI_03445 [Pyricularia grisea]
MRITINPQLIHFLIVVLFCLTITPVITQRIRLGASYRHHNDPSLGEKPSFCPA